MEIKLIHHGFIIIVSWVSLVFGFLCVALVAFFGYMIGEHYLHKRKWCCDRCEDVLPPVRLWGSSYRDYIIFPVTIEGGRNSEEYFQLLEFLNRKKEQESEHVKEEESTEK